ncbi:metal ABC transporter permease [Oecophyllibacter saccharovorans]|uniref:High-affinity zinc uptake system membrane protein ZnuB n=1 Tax=Oecophyllibacter saccharovorans TaxID=2558360 RepID=A0A506UKY8_9PROT|nr:metal ABC transporter permease [Oecophyllibacter saccharovorans]TPW33985.1 metal ABC transporter permease [Oecophyllibacter saccharovorans]
MFAYDFMRYAFLGCLLVALIAAPTGWFLLLRRQAFAAHALPHIGFSGAAAAVWLGVAPLEGMLAATLLAGLFMAWESQTPHDTFQLVQRETMTGLVLAASLGVGLWCLHEANGATNRATTLLFGDILGITPRDLEVLGSVGGVCALLLALMWRPLLFASLAPELAAARGVNMRLVTLGFMTLAALASAACSVVAGALLAFSLMIGPAAAALRLELPPIRGILFSLGTALVLSWGGLMLSWWTDAPVAFWISVGAVLLYMIACLVRRWRAA